MSADAAIEFARASPIEAGKVMSLYFQVDPHNCRQVLEDLDFTGLNPNHEYFGAPNNPGFISQVAFRASQIREKAAVIDKLEYSKDLINTDFLKTGGE